MTVYASTACLAGTRDLWEILAAYRAAGLRAVELGSCDVDTPVDELVERLLGERLKWAVHNYFPPPREPFVLNLASPDPALAERSLEFVLGSLELAARLSASVYSIHGGFVTDPAGFDGTKFVFPEPPSPDSGQEALERFVENLRPALASAERLGVRLLVENNSCSERDVGKLLLQSADEFETLFAELTSDRLGALVDFGHLNVTARTLGFDRLEFVARLAPRIGGFHVHDNDGHADRHLPAEPGSWVLEALARPEFAAVPKVVESRFDDPGRLAEHVAWLDRESAPGTVTTA